MVAFKCLKFWFSTTNTCWLYFFISMCTGYPSDLKWKKKDQIQIFQYPAVRFTAKNNDRWQSMSVSVLHFFGIGRKLCVDWSPAVGRLYVYVWISVENNPLKLRTWNTTCKKPSDSWMLTYHHEDALLFWKHRNVLENLPIRDAIIPSRSLSPSPTCNSNVR